MTKLDELGMFKDIRQKLKQEAVVEVYSPKEAESMEGESSWYGRGKTGEVCVQRGDEWPKTKRMIEKALDGQI